MTKFKPWEPGDAMYPRGDHPHSLYLYNFRAEELVDNGQRWVVVYEVSGRYLSGRSWGRAS